MVDCASCVQNSGWSHGNPCNIGWHVCSLSAKVAWATLKILLGGQDGQPCMMKCKPQAKHNIVSRARDPPIAPSFVIMVGRYITYHTDHTDPTTSSMNTRCIPKTSWYEMPYDVRPLLHSHCWLFVSFSHVVIIFLLQSMSKAT